MIKIKFIERFLDEHFLNSYKLRTRLGDLISYKELTLYVEDIISNTEFVCSIVDKNGTGKITNSEQQYKFASIKPMRNKTFASWSCWIAE